MENGLLWSDVWLCVNVQVSFLSVWFNMGLIRISRDIWGPQSHGHHRDPEDLVLGWEHHILSVLWSVVGHNQAQAQLFSRWFPCFYLSWGRRFCPFGHIEVVLIRGRASERRVFYPKFMLCSLPEQLINGGVLHSARASSECWSSLVLVVREEH